MDIFVHALPPKGQVKFRNLLDKGYEAMGHYKDVTDAQKVLDKVVPGSVKTASGKQVGGEDAKSCSSASRCGW